MTPTSTGATLVVGLLLLLPAAAGELAAESSIADHVRYASVVQPPRASQKTVWQGVYTEEQAKRGQSLYQQKCSYCHRDDLRGFGGDSAAAALMGARFFLRWRNEAVAELFDIVAETMPKDSAEVLSPQSNADILSYIFKVNDMPAGATELPPDSALLQQIVIVDKEPKGVALLARFGE